MDSEKKGFSNKSQQPAGRHQSIPPCLFNRDFLSAYYALHTVGEACLETREMLNVTGACWSRKMKDEPGCWQEQCKISF